MRLAVAVAISVTVGMSITLAAQNWSSSLGALDAAHKAPLQAYRSHEVLKVVRGPQHGFFEPLLHLIDGRIEQIQSLRSMNQALGCPIDVDESKASRYHLLKCIWRLSYQVSKCYARALAGIEFQRHEFDVWISYTKVSLKPSRHVQGNTCQRIWASLFVSRVPQQLFENDSMVVCNV